MTRRGRLLTPPSPPTVPELVHAPELATVTLLEHALDLVAQALLAEHPTLADDFARARDDGPVLTLAHTICCQAAALQQALRRYNQALRAYAVPNLCRIDRQTPVQTCPRLTRRKPSECLENIPICATYRNRQAGISNPPVRGSSPFGRANLRRRAELLSRWIRRRWVATRPSWRGRRQRGLRL